MYFKGVQVQHRNFYFRFVSSVLLSSVVQYRRRFYLKGNKPLFPLSYLNMREEVGLLVTDLWTDGFWENLFFCYIPMSAFVTWVNAHMHIASAFKCTVTQIWSVCLLPPSLAWGFYNSLRRKSIASCKEQQVRNSTPLPPSPFCHADPSWAAHRPACFNTHAACFSSPPVTTSRLLSFYVLLACPYLDNFNLIPLVLVA